MVAGDNLFDFSLAEYVDFWRAKQDGSCIALYTVPDLRLVSQYSMVELASDDRVLSFVEKPAQPTSHLVGIATYIYSAAHAAMIPAYLAGGNSPDAPGHLVAWLCTRVPVYGYRIQGEWLDVGDKQQLLEADNRMRAKRGLPPRAEYTLADT